MVGKQAEPNEKISSSEGMMFLFAQRYDVSTNLLVVARFDVGGHFDVVGPLLTARKAVAASMHKVVPRAGLTLLTDETRTFLMHIPIIPQVTLLFCIQLRRHTPSNPSRELYSS